MIAKKKSAAAHARPPLVLHNYEPPQAIEAEGVLLAAMMTFSGECARWSQEMDAADFYRPHNAAIFTALQSMSMRNASLDFVTIISEIHTSGTLELCGGADYVAAIAAGDPYLKHAPVYARLVKEAARKRSMVESALGVIESAANGASMEEMGDAVGCMVTNSPLLADQHSSRARDIILALTERMEEMATNPRAMLGLATGLSSLDRMTNGLQAPDMIVLGARPGVGKSALMSGIAAHVGRQGIPVFIASMEMSQQQVMTRMICAEARLDSHRLRAGRLSTKEWAQYSAAVNPLFNAPITINDRSGVTPAYLRAELRKFVRENGSIGLVCVDYLQLMQSDHKIINRYEELSNVSMELKGISREFNVPVLALTQINRESVKRDNKRPMLSDIRDTGQIEQDADIVMFLHRPDQFTPEGNGYAQADLDKPVVARDAELIFAKQRNGPQGVIHLDFIDQFAVFIEPNSCTPPTPAGKELAGNGYRPPI